MYINHITLSTGHIAKSPRSDVTDATLALLVPWLQSTVESGQQEPLPATDLSHYSAQAIVQDGALVVTIYGPAGPHKPGAPHVGEKLPLITMGVAHRSRHGAPLWGQLVAAFGAHPTLQRPPEPWCAIALHPTLAAYPDSAHWLGDFERCVAWAWITRNPDLRVAS